MVLQCCQIDSVDRNARLLWSRRFTGNLIEKYGGCDVTSFLVEAVIVTRFFFSVWSIEFEMLNGVEILSKFH